MLTQYFQLEVEVQIPHLAFVDNQESGGFVALCRTFNSELPMRSPLILWWE